MDLLEHLNRSPFRELVGIEITEAGEGAPAERLPLNRKHPPRGGACSAQGGGAFTLADSVGGAAAISLEGRPTPTIDFRIDYLRPATDDLRAEGEVTRSGSETAVVDVVVTDADGEDVALARGVYKTSELAVDAPWEIETSG